MKRPSASERSILWRRKKVGKGRSLSGDGVYLEADIFLVDDAFDNSQADPEASLDIIFSVVAVENLRRVFNPDPKILDPETDHSLFIIKPHPYHTLFMAVLDGIGEGIVHDPLQLGRGEVEVDIRLDLRLNTDIPQCGHLGEVIDPLA